MKKGDVPLQEIVTRESRITRALRVGKVNVTEQVLSMTVREICERLKDLSARSCGFFHERTGAAIEECPFRKNNLSCAHGTGNKGKKSDVGAGHVLRHGIAAADLIGVMPESPDVIFEAREQGAYPNIVPYEGLADLDNRANAQARVSGGDSRKANDVWMSIARDHESIGKKMLRLRDSLLVSLSSILDQEWEYETIEQDAHVLVNEPTQ